MKNWILFISFLLSLGAGAQGSDVVTVSAVGDIMMGTNYPRKMLPADQGKSFFKQAAPYIKATDIRFGNFEGTFFEGPPQADGKSPGPNRYLFQTPLDFVERLVEAGFNVMSLANNHSRDFGKAGLLSTQQTLRLAGIQYSGKDDSVARFNVRGKKVSLLAADYYKGVRSIITPNSTYEEISQVKKESDIVLVSVHAGGEGAGAQHVKPGEEIFLGENRGDSIAFAHRAIDAGADLIIMHGPHVPRGLEVYRNRLIIYSLGNFATGQGVSINGVPGIAPLIQVQLDGQGRFLNGKIISFRQVRPEATTLDPQKRAFQLMKSLSVQDFPKTSPQFSDTDFYSFQ